MARKQKDMKNCKDCGQDMEIRWPQIASKLEICPPCSALKVKGKATVYKMFGSNKPPN